MTHLKTSFISFFLIFALSFQSYAVSTCASRLGLAPRHGPAYVLGIQDRAHQISLGLEIEFEPIGRNPKILEDYRFQFYKGDDLIWTTTEQAWELYTIEEKLKIYEHQKKDDKVKAKLVKMKNAPGWMPDQLKTEVRNRFEANDFIFEDLDSLQKLLYATEERYGRGAAQSWVVFPAHPQLKGNAGFLAFSGDRAQLKNLEKSYKKFLLNESKIPAANFTHPFLKPMNKSGIDYARKSEDEIFAKKNNYFSNIWDGKGFLAVILRTVSNQGPQVLVGFEHREFNFDYEGLIGETSRTIGYLEKNLVGHFKIFDLDYKMVSQSAEFESELNKKVLTYIEVNGATREYALKLIEPYLFGFRNWAEHPILQTISPELRDKKKFEILRAQKVLALEFLSIMKSHDHFISCINEFRIAIADFAYRVQLGDLFDNFYNNLLPDP